MMAKEARPDQASISLWPIIEHLIIYKHTCNIGWANPLL